MVKVGVVDWFTRSVEVVFDSDDDVLSIAIRYRNGEVYDIEIERKIPRLRRKIEIDIQIVKFESVFTRDRVYVRGYVSVYMFDYYVNVPPIIINVTHNDKRVQLLLERITSYVNALARHGRRGL